MKSLRLVLICSSVLVTLVMNVYSQPRGPVSKSEAKSTVTLAETTTTAAPSEYQELRCRGGAGLSITSVEGRANASGEQIMYMTVVFRPAKKPSDPFGRDLEAGHCAFPERALRSDEPNEIIQEIVHFGQLRQQLHGSAVDTSPTAAERFPDAQNVPQYLADPKHYWSFFVRQNGPLPFGRFEASYGKYWKPAPPLRPQDKIRRTQP